MRFLKTLLLAGALSAAAVLPAPAATLRFAGSVSPLTFDPHGTNDFTTTALFRQVYDSLVALTPEMKPVPGLATAWERSGEAGWRFTLRPGVRFHDGSPLTAEDVVFSILRAKGSSYYAALFGKITEAVAVGDGVVEVRSSEPDPILPDKMARMFIMSRSWALAHDLAAIPNLGAQGSEAYSVRHANGTGPMRLVEQQPGVRTVFARFDGYWGGGTGNVTEATYLPISAAPTRVAALLSGEVDVITDLPLQDVSRVQATPTLTVRQIPQLLWMQLEMDGSREVALDSWDKAGRPLTGNPFRDTRVRQAISRAVDPKLIVDRVLRGFARVVSIPSIPGFGGYQADLDVRPQPDPAAARRLLAEAGYPEGFVTQMNCPADRYASAEDVCRAVAGMLARIGIEVRVKTLAWPEFARMLVNGPNSSFHLIGVASSWDTQDAFTALMMTRDTRAGEGFFNWAMWSNPQVDAIARELRVTFDPARRQALYREGLRIGRDEAYAATLYQPFLVWAAKRGVEGTVRPDATLLLQDVTVRN